MVRFAKYISVLVVGLSFLGCEGFLKPVGPIIGDSMPTGITSIRKIDSKIEVCGDQLGSDASAAENVEQNEGDHYVIWINNTSFDATASQDDPINCIVGMNPANQQIPSGSVKVFVATSVNHVVVASVTDAYLGL